jgi:hypothetical protein
MRKQFAKLSSGVLISFVNGNFDEWCIEITYPTGKKTYPKDSEYFTELKELNETEPTIYEDFVTIYDLTEKEPTQEVKDLCNKLASKYKKPNKVERLFLTLYAGMIAEENKADTKLGKRIKRLGMHQLLVEQGHPVIVANYSRGLNWKAIDAECKARGF